MTTADQTVTVVILAFGPEPYLRECVDAVLGDAPVDLQVIIVDNGADAAVRALPSDGRVEIVRPTTNLGFAGGCNEAARHSTGDTLVLLNSDAIVAPGAIDRLVATLDAPDVGIASAAVRLAQRPGEMNSVGNPVHFLGVVWAGGYGDRVDAHLIRTDIASASGALLAIRRDRWNAVGGFADEYFAYHEDTDLSLRVWQRGWRVVFEPEAIVYHHYEFSRNDLKQYLIERNRWLTVLTVYPARLLWLIVPALVGFEIALAALATVQGWLPQKVKGWLWLIRHCAWIRARRILVQQGRVMSTHDFADLLSARIEPAMVERPPGSAFLNAVLATYWSIVRKLLR